jgi:hypothetical protein
VVSRRWKGFVVLGGLVLVSGCSPGPTGRVAAMSPAPAARLVAIRESSFTGTTDRYTITVDGADVLALRPGEHATIGIEAGPRVIGVRCLGIAVPMRRHDILSLKAEAGGRYYVQVAPSPDCASIRRLDDAYGLHLMNSTSPQGVD